MGRCWPLMFVSINMKITIPLVSRLNDNQDGGYTMYIYNNTEEMLEDHPIKELTYGQEINSGLDAALKYMNLEFEGRRHDGQADAINQARLMCKMMQESRTHIVKNDTQLSSGSLF